ncbi:ankyrin repeat-containing protein NPR4-like [Rhododendron vialii]|uniref:ankyrin repeat-containing protein NPR4-like n=1 Tax=Rhododendron vialii TaxID=182163 RepID=UPI00265DECAB|nr:ankyrin repeat-containing protein NPR4-like [Rhododendron vialii]
MNKTEEEAKRLYEACLSGSVETLNALLVKDQLILNRVSSAECFSSDTPLHVAASCGHLELTKALLLRKPNLATELDSRRCTPLHLASTEGHFEIVRELLRVNPDVCIARDQDGRIPLHSAVTKGRVEVIRELLGTKPRSVHDKLGRGETVLHLSVKYNRLEALKTLVEYLQSKNMESDLLNSIDDDGNTILHLAAALKQVDTVEYLLGIKSVRDHANDKNQSGSTALDIVEHCPNRDLKTMEIRVFLLQADVHRSNYDGPKQNSELPPNNPPRTDQHFCGKTGVIFMGCISWFWTRFKVDRGWLKEVRGHLITAATLTATMAYQSILSPPGGLWQETKKDDSLAPSPSLGYSTTVDDEQTAGHAIMDKHGSYHTYLALNTVVLGASLSTIMLAMTGFPMENKFITWSLVFTVYLTITCMGAAYVTAINLVSPEPTSEDALDALLLSWLALCSFFVMALHSCQFLVWLGKKLVRLVKACYGCCKPTPRTTNNNKKDNLAGTHKCVGNIC